jgi:hypothetical protein
MKRKSDELELTKDPAPTTERDESWITEAIEAGLDKEAI